MVSPGDLRDAETESDDGDHFQRVTLPQAIILMGVRWYVALG